MKRERLVILFMLFVFFLMGCVATNGQHNQLSDNKKHTVCSDPRPQVCTMDYNPVCGEKKDGSHKTYSNGCTACSDHKVIGYVDGECE